MLINIKIQQFSEQLPIIRSKKDFGPIPRNDSPLIIPLEYITRQLAPTFHILRPPILLTMPFQKRMKTCFLSKNPFFIFFLIFHNLKTFCFLHKNPN